MHLFYSKVCNISEFALCKEESFHCNKVLRLKKSDKINVTNGKGLLVEAEILSDIQTEVILKTTKVIENKDIQDFKLHIALAPLKNSSRYEWFVEKSVELGITEITPIITKFTEKKQYKTDRLKRIVLEAMKQSQRTFLPIVNEPERIEVFLKNSISKNKYIAYCGTCEKEILNKELSLSNEVLFVVGPEGDFDTKEIDFAITNGYIPISLGNYRLRSETAALHLCSITNFMNSKGVK